jgi:hypothetical protein
MRWRRERPPPPSLPFRRSRRRSPRPLLQRAFPRRPLRPRSRPAGRSRCRRHLPRRSALRRLSRAHPPRRWIRWRSPRKRCEARSRWRLRRCSRPSRNTQLSHPQLDPRSRRLSARRPSRATLAAATRALSRLRVPPWRRSPSRRHGRHPLGWGRPRGHHRTEGEVTRLRRGRSCRSGRSRRHHLRSDQT